MNFLFYYVGAMDTKEKGEYEQLMEFFKLEKEIAAYQEEQIELLLSGKRKPGSCKHDFALAAMRARAKTILRNLDIIN